VSCQGIDPKIRVGVVPYQGIPELAFVKLHEKWSTDMNGLRSSGGYFIIMNTGKLQTIGPVALKSRTGLC